MPFPLVHCRFNSYFQTSISDSSNCWLQRIRRDQHLSIDCNQFCSKAFKWNQFLCILYPLNWTHPTSHHFCWIIHCTITFNQYKFIQKNLKMNHNYFPFLIFFSFLFFRLIFSSLNEFDSYSNLSLDFLTELTPFMNLYFYSVDMKFESTQKNIICSSAVSMDEKNHKFMAFAIHRWEKNFRFYLHSIFLKAQQNGDKLQ